MKFELKALEQLINIAVNPANLTKQRLTNDFIIESKWLLKSEIEKTIEAFNAVAFTQAVNESTRHYFTHHQMAITQLSDKVCEYQEQFSDESIYNINTNISLNSLHSDITEKLEELVEYIERRLPVYFDTALNISQVKRKSFLPEITRALRSIEKELRKITVPEDLIAIACIPFKEFCTTEKLISHQDLSYLKVFQIEFTFFIDELNSTNATEKFCELLVYLNFNSLIFHDFLITDFQEKGKACETLPQQLENIYLKLKLLNQLPVLPGLALRPGMPNIKEQISNWILEEQSFLEKRLQLLRHAGDTSDDQLKTEKIQIGMSVSHISLGMRLLLESNMISNKNPTEMMRLVARNFKTDRNEDISENSMRNKYYSVDSATLISMREMIAELISLVEQYES